MRFRVAGIVAISILTLHFACSSDDDATPGAGTSSGTTPTGTSSGSTSGTTSGSTSSGSSSSGNPPALAPCEAMAAHDCEQLFKCVAADVGGRADELDKCKKREALLCHHVEEYSGVTKATDCAPPIGPFTCDGSSPTWTPLPAGCSPKGTVAKNAPCQIDRQCATGFCFIEFGSKCGVCAPPSPESGDCSPSIPCADGLRCIGGKCHAPAAKDAPCPVDPDIACADGLYCKSGTCTPYLPEGADCTSLKDQCDLTLSLTCIHQKCTRANYVAMTGNCGSPVFENINVCMNRVACELQGPGQENGKCVPDAEDGAACGESGPYCQAGSSCQSAKCALEPIEQCN